MRGKRTRTVSVSLGDRGQTTQDFAVGIGIFLLAMAFVFSYVPTLLTPFTTDVGAGETAQADRIAATIVDDLSEEEPNHLNVSEFDDYEHGSDELIDELGLRSADGEDIAVNRVNVTFESLDGTERYVLTGGDDHDDADATASAGRIVTVDDPNEVESGCNDDCDTAYRLVVRVW